MTTLRSMEKSTLLKSLLTDSLVKREGLDLLPLMTMILWIKLYVSNFTPSLDIQPQYKAKFRDYGISYVPVLFATSYVAGLCGNMYFKEVLSPLLKNCLVFCVLLYDSECVCIRSLIF